MRNNCHFKVDILKTLFVEVMMLILLISSAIGCTSTIATNNNCKEPNFTNANIEDGNYLLYDVKIDTIIVSVSNWTSLEDSNESDEYYEELGSLRFEVINVTDQSVFMKSTFRFSTTTTNGNYNFDKTVVFTLKRNEVHINNTFWGYCPFFYPGTLPIKSNSQSPNQSESLIFSGVKDREYSYVYMKEQLDTVEKRSEGLQYCAFIESKTYYLKSKQAFNAMSMYEYDKSAGIAYSITTDDPWWYIFTDNITFRGRKTILTDYQWDLGPGDKLGELIYVTMFIIWQPLGLIGVIVILLSGFYLWHKRNTTRKR